MIPYILPLLQTSLTISVYSTVAITLHGLHEIQKSTKMTSAMSPLPSNANGGDLVEYESMITATGMLKVISILSYHISKIKIALVSNYTKT